MPAPMPADANNDVDRLEPFGFDAQASSFGERTGLPPAAAAEVARQIRAATDLRGGDWVLELGAGTGEIGERLAGDAGEYLGVDLSRPMLVVFRARARRARLVQADANADWPVADGCVRVVFLARTAHLLDEGHLARELGRVGRRDGAYLVLGAVRRDPTSVRARMRASMRELLAERGIPGRSGRASKEGLVEALAARGAAPRSVAAARWRVRETPAASLRSWRQKPGLAGRDVAVETKREVLDALEGWAAEHFGALDAEHEAEELFELTVVRVPAGGTRA